jgi:thioesterase domain-containing protein
MVALDNTPVANLGLPGLTLSALPQISTTAQFELSLNLSDAGGVLAGAIAYASDLFDRTTIERAAGHFMNLLHGMVADPAQRVAELPWMTAAERHQVLVGFNDSRASFPRCDGEVPENAGEVPIGTPGANTRVYILDPWLQPVPIGVSGELYIAGAGVARGYSNRAEPAAERFIDDPFSDDRGSRMYKSGDLGRWRPDGSIEYIGRDDSQVKIRGYRIELGEIESQLLLCSGVREAAVNLHGDGEEKRLIAYLALREGMSLSAGAIRGQLLHSLPDYMVPSLYVQLDGLPMTSSGKLDRRALPTPDRAAVASRRHEMPEGAIEQAIAEVWQGLLGIERVGRDDNFFELGAHSLLLMRAATLLSARVGRKIPLFAFFAQPSAAALATWLDGNTVRSSESFAITLRAQASAGHAVLFMPTMLGVGSLYGRLAQRLGVAADILTCRLPGGQDGETPLRSIEEIAAFCRELLVDRSKHAAWTVVGWSFGGVLAYEVARQLSEAGLSVSGLILLDSYLPATGTGVGVPRLQWVEELERELGADIGTHLDTQRMAVLREANDAAFHSYRASGYDGKTLELRARESLHLLTGPENEVLRPLPLGPHRLEILPTSHHAMLSEEQLPALAERIAEFLAATTIEPPIETECDDQPEES